MAFDHCDSKNGSLAVVDSAVRMDAVASAISSHIEKFSPSTMIYTIGLTIKDKIWTHANDKPLGAYTPWSEK